MVTTGLPTLFPLLVFHHELVIRRRAPSRNPTLLLRRTYLCPCGGFWILGRMDTNLLLRAASERGPEGLRPSRAHDHHDAQQLLFGLPHGPDARSPRWQYDIWQILMDFGATELLEQGPVVYLSSHFISHRHHHRNFDSRPLRFDSDITDWEAGIRLTWEDLIDEDADFEVFLVNPAPPATIFQGTSGTVIVVQHPLPGRAACVITGVVEAIHAPSIVETAHSFEIEMHRRGIIRLRCC